MVLWGGEYVEGGVWCGGRGGENGDGWDKEGGRFRIGDSGCGCSSAVHFNVCVV